jgi:hypothetical protein
MNHIEGFRRVWRNGWVQAALHELSNLLVSRLSQKHCSNKRICDSFGSAEEAAESANRKRFDSEAAAAGFGGSYVPWDLNLWSKSPPEEPLEPEVSAETNPSECKNRPWQHGRNRF